MGATYSGLSVTAIPGLAREFMQRVHQECNMQLDFSEASVAKLDDIVKTWRPLGREKQDDVLDGMSFFFGEVIRRNLGGRWVDPKWKDPNDVSTPCYLSKAAGVCDVFPHQIARRYFLEGGRQSFTLYYESVKQEAKSTRRESAACYEKGRREKVRHPVPLQALAMDRATSIICIMQFLSVIMGWVICRVVGRVSGGMNDPGFVGLLLRRGYLLALIPIIWTRAKIYAYSSNRVPEIVDKVLIAVGVISVVLVSGLFGFLVVGMILSWGAEI
jgi:hypothetical protein